MPKADLQSLSGHAASDICFGCMQFGGTANHSESLAMFETCRNAGLNFFDTANAYTDGTSETWLGEFARSARDDLIIATKAGYIGGSGRQNLLRQFDESRRRLGFDVIDILFLHRWDAETALEETFETLARLQSDGQIRQIGVSNFAAWQVMKAQTVAQSLGTAIDILQPMYSLVKRQAEVELFPMALSEGFKVAAYSPLGGGLLTGKYRAGGDGRLVEDQRYAARYGQSWMFETANALAELGREVGIDPATLAVAWAKSHPSVSAPIISARDVRQLGPSLAAGQLELSDELHDRISALSPRPAPATDRLEEAGG